MRHQELKNSRLPCKHSFGALDDKFTCERMASKFLNENARLDHAEIEERRFLRCGHQSAEDDLIRAIGGFVDQGTVAVIGSSENSRPLKLQKHLSEKSWVRTSLEPRFAEAVLWKLSPEGPILIYLVTHPLLPRSDDDL